MQRNDLLQSIYSSLDKFIMSSTSCALVDFPNHANVGDSAIWLGEVDFFLRRRKKISYVCQIENYNKTLLKKSCPDGPIFIHGGGNFGDLWPQHQIFREQIIKDFSDRLIVQLPQSIFFKEDSSLDRTVKIINSHPNFVLFVRDSYSFAFAKKYFRCQTILCPDMAFAMNYNRFNQISVQKRYKIVYLSRTDKEAISKTYYNQSKDILVTDWITESPPKRKNFYNLTAKGEKIFSFFWGNFVQSIKLKASIAMANERLVRGLNILAQGKCVVTDRLHGMILSLFLNRPVYVFDNSYGKLSNFINTWLKDIKILSLFKTEKEAIDAALNNDVL